MPATEGVPLTEAACQALQRVCEVIEAHPESLDMYSFFEVRGGTVTACVAGHLAMLTKSARDLDRLVEDRAEYTIVEHAAAALELPVRLAMPLFHTSSWPADYREEWRLREYPSLVVALLREIIQRRSLWWLPAPQQPKVPTHAQGR